MENQVKSYAADIRVTAMFYDGSIVSAAKVVQFSKKKYGDDYMADILYSANGKHVLIIRNRLVEPKFIVVKPDNYVVRYKSGLMFPMGKQSFEKRFKETEPEEKL